MRWFCEYSNENSQRSLLTRSLGPWAMGSLAHSRCKLPLNRMNSNICLYRGTSIESRFTVSALFLVLFFFLYYSGCPFPRTRCILISSLKTCSSSFMPFFCSSWLLDPFFISTRFSSTELRCMTQGSLFHFLLGSTGIAPKSEGLWMLQILFTQNQPHVQPNTYDRALGLSHLGEWHLLLRHP